ncbi:hypothetical protein CEE69_02340 [Rhodopirellula bahusiensis]|uniref:Uncharacterized protein n=1 Tax=Rhodopirellula bahusiensis TaxID=2014065 RepID=A0A2G1WDW1_9BACT|nr:hypothetical protein CEE69_02340 [Rhodopirellula bahusiensis]
MKPVRVDAGQVSWPAGEWRNIDSTLDMVPVTIRSPTRQRMKKPDLFPPKKAGLDSRNRSERSTGSPLPGIDLLSRVLLSPMDQRSVGRF